MLYGDLIETDNQSFRVSPFPCISHYKISKTHLEDENKIQRNQDSTFIKKIKDFFLFVIHHFHEPTSLLSLLCRPSSLFVLFIFLFCFVLILVIAF